MLKGKNAKAILCFLAVLAILTAIGFAGYYFGFLGFIYKVMMPEAFSNFPLVALSIIFGIAAFFSPCTLTVLPGFVSHYLTREKKSRATHGFYFGILAALGVVTVNIIVGLIIAFLGAAAPFAKDPREDIPLILGVRIVAGILIAYMGYLTLKGKSFEIPLLQAAVLKGSTYKSAFLYGLLYNAAAIGCTGPILLGLILYALTAGSFLNAFLAFLIFALTMGILMILLTTGISVFQTTIMKKVMPLTPIIHKFAGFTMIFAGLTIALLTLEGNRLFVKLFFPFLR